jgi:hypothetical protein
MSTERREHAHCNEHKLNFLGVLSCCFWYTISYKMWPTNYGPVYRHSVNIAKTGENVPKFYKLVFNPNFHPIF